MPASTRRNCSASTVERPPSVPAAEHPDKFLTSDPMTKFQTSIALAMGFTACIAAAQPSDDMADFKKALDMLPPDQREAVILIGASGFSYEEAAEICKCAVGTMKSRVSRARTRLMDVLKISGEADYGPDAVSAQVTTHTLT